MKYKALAIPEPSVGQKTTGDKLVVPNQALSLREILERFTRNETLAIGREGNYHESDDDLEKVAHMDLVDREEFAEKQKATQRNYELQEKRKEAAAKKKAEELAVQKAKEELEKQGKPGLGG